MGNFFYFNETGEIFLNGSNLKTSSKKYPAILKEICTKGFYENKNTDFNDLCMFLDKKGLNNIIYIDDGKIKFNNKINNKQIKSYDESNTPNKEYNEELNNLIRTNSEFLFRGVTFSYSGNRILNNISKTKLKNIEIYLSDYLDTNNFNISVRDRKIENININPENARATNYSQLILLGILNGFASLFKIIKTKNINVSIYLINYCHVRSEGFYNKNDDGKSDGNGKLFTSLSPGFLGEKKYSEAFCYSEKTEKKLYEVMKNLSFPNSDFISENKKFEFNGEKEINNLDDFLEILGLNQEGNIVKNILYKTEDINEQFNILKKQYSI